MGKLTGIITGLAAVTILGFFVFSQYFSPLENWLSPFFGPVIYIIFGIVFFLFANPLSYPVLVVSQIGIGLLIGVSARKGTRAIGAAISVYALIWLIIVLSVLYLLTETNLSSSAFSGLTAAIPPGTNLASIMGEPVLRRLPVFLSTITGGLSGGSGSLGLTSFTSQLMPLLETAVINFVVFIVASGVFGLIIGRILKRRPLGPAPQSVPESTPEKSTPASLIILLVLLLVAPVAMTALPTTGDSPSQVITGEQQSYVGSFALSVVSSIVGHNSDSAIPYISHNPALSPYVSLSTNNSESAAYVISNNGSLYSAYAFFQQATNSTNMFSNLSGYSDLNFGMGIETSSLQHIFYGLGFGSNGSSISGSFGSIANLIPPELLVLGFSSNVSLNQAQRFANSYFKLMGISSNVLIITFSGSSFAGVTLPVAGNIFIYGANVPFSSIATRMAGNYTNRIQSTGLVEALNAQLRNGYMVPGSQANPMGGTIIVSGFMGPSSLGDLFSVGNLSNAGLIPNGTMNFLISFASNNYAFNYRDEKIPLTLANLTGSTKSFSFSSNDLSMLMAAFPGNGTSSNVSVNVSVPGMTGYNVVLYTDSLGFTNATGFNITGLNLTIPGQGGLVPPGYTFSPQTPIGNITANLTGDISQSVSVTTLSGKRAEIKVTIYDNSSLPIFNVSSQISPGFGYSNVTTILSGSVSKTISKINAGSSYSYNATFSVNNSGIYYMTPSLLTYTYNDTNYSRYSPSIVTKIGSASYLHTYTNVFDSAAERFVGPSYVNIPGTTIPLFLVLIALIIAGDVYIEYRALKRWLKHQ